MKRILLILASLIPCCSPVPCPAAPLTPAQAAMVRDIQVKAEAAIKEDDAEKAEELTEHRAHLAAEAAAAEARQQADALGKAAATAAAQRDAALKERDAADKAKWHARELLAAVAVFGLLLIASIGAELQALLRAELTAVGKLALTAIKALRLGLKAACPTIFFWL